MATITSNESEQLQANVASAVAERRPLLIQGGGSKSFLKLNADDHIVVSTSKHCGVIQYEPSELVLRVRSGTPLTEVTELLASEKQMLMFEPPHFGSGATVGGMVALGLAGPGRPFNGAVRDHVLGVKYINGLGEMQHAGGQVVKNVAGYDVARLMTGARGTLGVLLDVSLRVAPIPEQELTLVLACAAPEALRKFSRWCSRSLPLSALCHYDGQIYLRLSGNEHAVAAARREIGGEAMDKTSFWDQLKEHSLPFFDNPEPLWRLSVAPATADLELDGPCLYDWGGAQRWLLSGARGEDIKSKVKACGGYAVAFRRAQGDGDSQLGLEPALQHLHREIRRAFDPHGLFNQSMVDYWIGV